MGCFDKPFLLLEFYNFSFIKEIFKKRKKKQMQLSEQTKGNMQKEKCSFYFFLRNQTYKFDFAFVYLSPKRYNLCENAVTLNKMVWTLISL